MPQPESFLIGEDLLRDIMRVLRKVEGMTLRGPHVSFTNGPGGISGFIGAPENGGEEGPGRDWFWAKITGSLEIVGASNRWQYAYTEQRRTATGFEALTDGRTGTTDTRFAINSIEANNTASSIQGNSIDHDDADYPSGFQLLAVRGNPVVQMWVSSDSDGNTAYTFSYENAEQGPCE